MSKIRHITVLVFAALLFSQSGSAMSRSGWYIAGGASAAAGAIMLAMGGMLTKFAQDDDGVIASRYGTTTLTIQNYTITQDQCAIHSGKTVHYYPYTATCQDAYQVQTGNITESYFVSYGQVCGDTASDALANAQATYPMGSGWTIYYPYTDHAAWTQRIPTSVLWFGAIPLYCVGGPILLGGVALIAIRMCA